MSGQLAQFLASLVAILALAGLARWLRLGPEARLNDEIAARDAAREAVDGFEATHVAVDRGGRGALLLDSGGRLLLLRAHGTHMASRILTFQASARLIEGSFEIDTGEKRFGSIRLSLDDAQAWVQRVEALRSSSHA